MPESFKVQLHALRGLLSIVQLHCQSWWPELVGNRWHWQVRKEKVIVITITWQSRWHGCNSFGSASGHSRKTCKHWHKGYKAGIWYSGHLVGRASEKIPKAWAMVIASVLFNLCRGITLHVTGRVQWKMERDYLEAPEQTSGLYSTLLTARMLQGKIKWTESPEKCLHKNDVEL